MTNRYLSLEAIEVVNTFEECYLNVVAEPIMNTGETVEASESLTEESDLSDVAVEDDIVTPNRRLYLKKRRIIQMDSEDGGDLKKTTEEGNSSSSTPSRKRNVPDEVRVSCGLPYAMNFRVLSTATN